MLKAHEKKNNGLFIQDAGSRSSTYTSGAAFEGGFGGAIVLARRGSTSMHLIDRDQKKHLSVLSCVDVAGGYIPNFYILKGIYFREDYIANCKEEAVMDMQPNARMTR